MYTAIDGTKWLRKEDEERGNQLHNVIAHCFHLMYNLRALMKVITERIRDRLSLEGRERERERERENLVTYSFI